MTVKFTALLDVFLQQKSEERTMNYNRRLDKEHARIFKEPKKEASFDHYHKTNEY